MTLARATRWRTALSGPPEPDGDERADRLAVAEHGGVLEPGVGGRLDAEAAQDGREDDGSGALAAVGDLERDAAAVGEAHGVDGLGAVLGDRALRAADEGGDVAAGAAEVLGVGADRGGDVALGGARAARRRGGRRRGPGR